MSGARGERDREMVKRACFLYYICFWVMLKVVSHGV